MNHNALLKTYTTLLPWNLARKKCFVNMTLGMMSSGSVQQHNTAIGFSGSSTQKSVCERARVFLKDFTFNYGDIAKALVDISGVQGPADGLEGFEGIYIPCEGHV